MNEWNSLVEEYFKTQRQHRSRMEVEYEAKIGTDGGPLHKSCIACNRVEGHNVASLMKCTGCKVVRRVLVS